MANKQLQKLEDALHFARKREQRVWGSGDEHEQVRAEVERLEALIASWPNSDTTDKMESPDTKRLKR